MECPYCGGTSGYYYWVKERIGAEFGHDDAEALDYRTYPLKTIYCQDCNRRLSMKYGPSRRQKAKEVENENSQIATKSG